MKLIFKTIKLTNFMSYQEAELSLDKKGFILVSGVNNNPIDNAKSNGTGKSSLFSAISWALTGLTVQGSKEVANIYLSGPTKVELDFELDSNTYKLIRTKNPSNLKLFFNGEDKSGKGIRDTEKILSDYIPDLTHVLLNSVIILGQGLPQKFTNNSPSGRKEVLEKLSNSDFMIADLKDRVSTRATYLKSSLRSTEDAHLKAVTTQEILTSQVAREKQQLESFSEEAYEQLQNQLEEKQVEMIECDKKLQSQINDISKLEQTITNLQSSLNTALTEYNTSVIDPIKQEISTLNTQLGAINSDIKNISHEITKLENVTDICPTCGQKLPDVHKIDTTELHKQLDDLHIQKYNLEQSKQEKITEVNNKMQEFEKSQEQQSQELIAFQSNLKQANNRRMELFGIQSSLKTQVDNLKTNINSYNHQKSQLQQVIVEHETELDDLQKNILCYNENINIITSQLDINSKMNTMLSRDFRGYLLSNIIEFISKQAKQYSLELFGTDKLDFILDGNNISITYDSKDYEVLSGGEQQKIDVIIQFAIRDMLCKYLNFSSNILVLDEITDSLDIVGSQKMFNLISKKLNDVEAIYIISHHQDDFEVPYDDKILVVKGEDRISRIKI